MEIVIAVFLGAWLTASVILAYFRLKKDYSEVLDETPDKREDK